MAVRATWTGTLTVGLLSVPVKLFAAVKHKSIAFNQVDGQSGARIRYQKVSEATGELVDSEHIVKGYELGSGHYVVIDDDDLKALTPSKSKEIAVDVFVPADQVPMIMFDASYVVGPGKLGAKPYALLNRAMYETGRVAIGKFVMRQKEYLAAIRSEGDRLTLSTLVFADEVVDPAAEEDLDAVIGVPLSDRERSMAASLVDAMADPWEPDQYQDTYRAAVMELIEAKAEGRAHVVMVGAPQPPNVVDLAMALEQSVEAAKASRRRHPTARVADPAKAALIEPKARRRKSA